MVNYVTGTFLQTKLYSIADYYMKICSSFFGKFDFPSFALMNAGNFSGWPTHRGKLN